MREPLRNKLQKGMAKLALRLLLWGCDRINFFKKHSRKEDIAISNQQLEDEIRTVIHKQMAICEKIRDLQYAIKTEMLNSEMAYINLCIANEIVNRHFDNFDFGFIYD